MNAAIAPTAIESIGQRLSSHARLHPGIPALTFVAADRSSETLNWSALESESNRLARHLALYGVDQSSRIAIALPNCPEHVLAAHAAWKLGACVLPLNPRLPDHELGAILAVAKPSHVVAGDDMGPKEGRLVRWSGLAARGRHPGDQLPDRVPSPGKAHVTGGSTGVPKLIVDPRPLGAPLRGIGNAVGLRAGQVQLVASALFHNSPFLFTHGGLHQDQHVILMERFEADLAIDLIEKHRVQFMSLVPTMMHRMLRAQQTSARDLSSIEAIVHGGAVCPLWLKRRWLELLGPTKVFEVYGATEAVGNTSIRGDEWLAHEGSVGRPIAGTEVRILDDQQRELPIGCVGTVYMRRASGPTPAGDYIGAPPARKTPEGFATVGDRGRLDDEGYLYIVDRRTDMIVTGGANVYPAEVEAALLEHPDVVDAVVVGRPDAEWGRRVHAVVQLAEGSTITSAALDEHLRSRLVSYKLPKSYQVVDRMPRDEAGKVRRSAFVEQDGEIA